MQWHIFICKILHFDVDFKDLHYNFNVSKSSVWCEFDESTWAFGLHLNYHYSNNDVLTKWRVNFNVNPPSNKSEQNYYSQRKLKKKKTKTKQSLIEVFVNLNGCRWARFSDTPRIAHEFLMIWMKKQIDSTFYFENISLRFFFPKCADLVLRLLLLAVCMFF